MPQRPSCAFLSPSTCELASRASTPASQLPGASVGSPAVPTNPTDDSPSTLRLTRTTPISVAGTRPATAPVRAASTPKLVSPTRPLSFVPTWSGTVSPLYKPMRRLQNGMTSGAMPGPKSKISVPSRKNDRFSGKKRLKRLTLVRRSSTSVSAKSVFTVRKASVLAPIRWVASRLPATVVSAPAAGAGTPLAMVSAGRTLRPRSRLKAGRSMSSPARLIWVMRQSRLG